MRGRAKSGACLGARVRRCARRLTKGASARSGQLAEVAIDSGTFDAIEPSLRLALAAIPLAHRDRMPGLPVKVWDALCADVLALLPQSEPDTGGGNAAPDDDEDEYEYMARFWYAVAAGEVRPNR